MHIAICNDNIADRKQLERLLKRESDKRASCFGNLYTDSYGNPKALLKNPMQYDVFFIDITNTEGISSMDVANSLMALGSKSPVILCCSDTDYPKSSLPDQVLFLNKPIVPEELSKILDEAQIIKDSSAPLIELREDKRTYYVTEPEILYARKKNRCLIITLTDGRTVRCDMTAFNLLTLLENYPTFFSPTSRSVVNGRHIVNIHFTKITMTDGTCFHALGPVIFYAKRIYNEFKENHSS